ncbi:MULTISPECIES: 3-oxoacyl-ACP reductase FabG [Pseudarthrobacter]|uniref:3-oxoacyl-ACP reductase FabG n=1 Tax=Pseudarthrobacter TaxID=1742993 RepID=UPI0012F7E233|nr:MULTISPECIES: 3-oxoacyl-ACP reductase FabG [Pseudarthrobacter]MEA3551251.1 3-oxoacyl-ACP reductase FabG [Pseudarthrobacter sp. C1]MUU72027.1 glucose 1-dehydrogenase [Pseudarthrobacter sp. GA104]WPU08973.1 3-oxoacyl-ACP reductase FabG [Pseudarthrobacter oxydans]HET7783592.1 3-oxoacyl-ACP reductase FabG [Arthrobacter sp.]
MNRLKNKTAIVTGGAQGIGAATALRLAAEGATVAILDLNAERAAATAAGISSDAAVGAAGGSAVSAACDVTSEEQVAEVFGQIFADHGRIDILVNNAGITRDNMLFKMDRPDWDSVLATNLTSAYLCAKAAQKFMVQARYGKIVSLSSRSALGNRGQANYAAAKAGIQGLTATLALELGPFNINVNAVAPGYIATAMTAATAGRVGSTPEEHQKSVAERTPLGRVGEPEEVAAAIAFFASDDSSYVSGQTLYINGGAR